jgi:alcohol dehydrogenase class IV
MRDIGIPNGIAAVGYTESDAPDLARGTMQQHRLIAGCPRDVTEEDINAILSGSVQNW